MLKKLALVAIAFALAAFVFHVNAQPADTDPITACRDPRFYSPVRIEFHNIPASYFEWNSDAPSWGYEALAAGEYSDQGVLIADVLDADTDGYAAGTASFVVYGDAPYTVTGDADSPLCDVASSPVQDDLPIVLTATPEPVETASTATCAAVWSYPYAYCYVPQANGAIPIPPPMN